MGQFFLRAEKYLDQIPSSKVGEFVEIGTNRNFRDGSTKTISTWAERYGKNLKSVDIDPRVCEFVKQFEIQNLELYNQTGESYLQKFIKSDQKISLLYLDNFDWDWHPEDSEDFVLEQQSRYQELGFEMTNVNSQRAHLDQMIAALPCMAEQCIVILDDTWFIKAWAHFSGKGGAVVPYLISNGFKVLETEPHPVYGTIMGRNIL
jgi:hypothetical protein